MKPTKPTEPPAKPQPAAKLTVQLTTRVTPAQRDIIAALAVAEGVTVQQLGIFAWNLALHAYGRPPLPDTNT